ncbi:Serine/threonine-protein phosphatase CPPED1-like 2 [Homarus americanus]|uniref:Serine/threonine-protein phosphatase CPPED1-like 2 n=1 Tax=Homarus americanus TaxID=6706 RepID=A0A8J5JNZ4_HOMAM|nr:Serine/threonine-protein phosphatase CPPED1-like 2 [Homarus americanus]
MEENKFLVLAQNRQFLPFFAEEEKEWQEPFVFIQAADTQFGMQEKYIEKKENYGWQQEIRWSRQMVEDVNTMFPRPKFLVVCGDLLDAWPHTEEEIRRQQEIDFKEVFAGLEVPLVCVCGNHDVGNTPTPATVNRYTSSFGDDYFSFWCGGVFFIVLNTQFYEDASQCPQLAEEQEAWLEEQLEVVKREKPQHAVIWNHKELNLCGRHIEFKMATVQDTLNFVFLFLPLHISFQCINIHNPGYENHL